MKVFNLLNKLSTEAVIFIILVVGGLIFKGTYIVSNIYFILGMLLLLWGILAILFNAHLFSGWKLNGNRKNSEFVEKIEHKALQSKTERAKEIAAQKNEPMRFTPLTRLILSYALILIVNAILVSFF